MAEPAGTAKEKILLASILGLLGAAPAPAQSRLCAGSLELLCTRGDWRVASPVPAPAGQWAQGWAPGECRAGWELDTHPQRTAGFLSSQVGPWWVPVSLLKGHLLPKAQPAATGASMHG